MVKKSLQAIKLAAQKVKESWSPPSYLSVHWDGKTINTLDGLSKQERLPILVSGVGGHKLLGAPLIKKNRSTPVGNLISQEALNLLDSWGCQANVIAMVFDTTASNT